MRSKKGMSTLTTIEVSTDGEYIPGIDEIVKQIQTSDVRAPNALAGNVDP